MGSSTFSSSSSSSTRPYFVDWFGQIWTSRHEVGSLIHTGAVDTTSIVSLSRDGVITPQIQGALDSIAEGADSGILIGPKVAENPNVYWYLLNTDNNLVAYIEGQTLRLEVDGARFLRTLNSRCIGERGQRGAEGVNGSDGAKGPDEESFEPCIDKHLLTAAIEVPIFIGTPISIRLDNPNYNIELRYYLDGTWEVLNGSVVVSKSSVVYDYRTQTLNISLFRNAWGNDWRLRVRQLGPTGDSGRDGAVFIQVNDAHIPEINCYEAVATVLSDSYDIRFGRKTFNSLESDFTSYVAHLRNNPNAALVDCTKSIDTLDGSYPDLWAAIEPTQHCSIFRWGLPPDRTIAPSIILPEWVPLRIYGYGGWTGVEKAADVPCCQENLFICHTPLTDICVSSSSDSNSSESSRTESSESGSSDSSQSNSSASSESKSSFSSESWSSESSISAHSESSNSCSSCSSVSSQSSESSGSSISESSVSSGSSVGGADESSSKSSASSEPYPDDSSSSSPGDDGDNSSSSSPGDDGDNSSSSSPGDETSRSSASSDSSDSSDSSEGDPCGDCTFHEYDIFGLERPFATVDTDHPDFINQYEWLKPALIDLVAWFNTFDWFDMSFFAAADPWQWYYQVQKNATPGLGFTYTIYMYAMYYCTPFYQYGALIAPANSWVIDIVALAATGTGHNLSTTGFIAKGIPAINACDGATGITWTTLHPTVSLANGTVLVLE